MGGDRKPELMGIQEDRFAPSPWSFEPPRRLPKGRRSLRFREWHQLPPMRAIKFSRDSRLSSLSLSSVSSTLASRILPMCATGKVAAQPDCLDVMHWCHRISILHRTRAKRPENKRPRQPAKAQLIGISGPDGCTPFTPHEAQPPIGSWPIWRASAPTPSMLLRSMWHFPRQGCSRALYQQPRLTHRSAWAARWRADLGDR